MAWTSRADRFENIEQNDPLGPGSYLGQVEYHPEPHYAPFGSSNPRATSTSGQDYNSQDQERYPSPPPGAYDPKLPKAYDSGLPRKHVPFTTGAPRISEKPAKGGGPGPGAYEVSPKLAEALSCRTMGVPPSEKAGVFRSASAPSIPTAHQSYGYEEAGDGRLIRQGPKDGAVMFSGKTGDTVGPGHYDYQAGATLRRTINGKILAPHGPRPEKVNNMPGPGHYDAKRPKQMAVSSSFVSQVSRQAKAKEKALQPGPGFYEPTGATRPDLREIHPELQYFGSTTERFKDLPASKQAPGPGAYQQYRRPKAKSDWIKSERFQGEEQRMAATMPGPGQYTPGAENKTSGALGTVSILGSTGCLAFGSMESKRFSGFKSEGPGPGAYHTPAEEPSASSTSGLAGRGGRRMSTKASRSVSAVFRSETPINAMVNLSIKEGQQRPPPGAYTPTLARDTGTVMRQPPKAEGFLSVERRGQFEGARPSAAPGPGRYDAPIEITGGKQIGSFNRTIVEGAPSGGRPRGLGFESQSRRFKLPFSKDTPGPGAYNTDPEWITKTHNIHFGDVG